MEKDTEEQKMKEALELVEKNKAERASAASKEIDEFMIALEEKYNVVIFIPQPEVPKLTILPK